MKLEQLPLLEPKETKEVDTVAAGWRTLVEGTTTRRIRVKLVKRPPDKKNS